MHDAPPLPIVLPAEVSATGVVAAFSGGLDSTVLLHRLADTPAVRARGLRAVHVHHGLHADADAWAQRCEVACARLDVPLQVVRVEVDPRSKLGLEGAARQARQQALASVLAPGELLALAHHRDDQAETFLLRALRASGPDGLGAMRVLRPFAEGFLWRPLLDVPRSALEEFARAHGLEWIDDPANASLAHDRNLLRHRILPLLRERWPHADAALARAAALQAEAADLLADEDAAALDRARTDAPNVLSIEALRMLPPARRARVLRRWITSLGLPPLPAEGVQRIETDLAACAPDADFAFAWSGAGLRRWRDCLRAAPLGPPLPADWSDTWDGRMPLVLPDGGQLALEGAAAFDVPVEVRLRGGGERITLPGRPHTHALKHVLQEAGIPPWERERMPLLFAPDGALLAAGDRIVAGELDGWLRARGACLRWTPGGAR